MRHTGRLPALAALLAAVAVLGASCASAETTADRTDIYDAAPWDDGERLEYSLRDEFGELIGHGELTARVEGGRLILEQTYAEADPPGDATPTADATMVAVDPSTFRPFEGWREIVRRDADGNVVEERYEWEYRDVEDERRIFTRHIVGDSVSEDDFAVGEHHYDNESALWLWRAAGLSEGFEEHYGSVNAIDGDESTVRLQVPQYETIEVPAGEFEAWRVLLRTGRATFTAWINADPPHEIVRWDNNELIFDLERRAGE